MGEERRGRREWGKREWGKKGGTKECSKRYTQQTSYDWFTIDD